MGLYSDYMGLYRDYIGLYRGYTGIMEKKVEATIYYMHNRVYWVGVILGSYMANGKEMETAIGHWGYIGFIQKKKEITLQGLRAYRL